MTKKDAVVTINAAFELGENDTKKNGKEKELSNRRKSRVTVQEPVFIKFDHLSVSAEEKQILNDISGKILPGELIAIMGPSGAGKSTLLNLLSGRETKGIVIDKGSVKINGEPATKKLRRKIGYVLQEDIFFSHLTVRQTLEFVGKIRLPDTLSWEEKKAIVDYVIEDLGLKKCENTVLGGGITGLKGCSGGEKKRCSIAVELITNPACIIMDEPTSGLDSATALNLLTTMKKLAREEKRTVCMTIHQPSSQIFHMFDKLLLLTQGQVAYYGQLADVLPFFESIGLPSYPNWNPADFIMEQLSHMADPEKIIQGYKNYKKNKVGLSELEDNVKGNKMILSPDHVKVNNAVLDDIGNSPCHKNIENDIDDILIKEGGGGSHEISKWPTGYKTQALALCQRAFIQSSKDVWDKLSFMQAFGISIIAGLVWFNTPYKEERMNDRVGVMFFVCIYMSMNQIFSAILTFPAEANVIAKERLAGMYRLSAYYTAKNVSDVPVIVLPQLIIYTIVYWMVGLNRSIIFLVGVLLTLTISLLAQAIGLVIGASIKNMKRAIVVTVLFSLGSMLLGGFYTKNVPSWLTWAKYASIFSYLFNIMLHMEFEFATNTFRCAENLSIYKECNGTDIITGPQVLPYVKTIDLDLYESFAVILALIIVLRISFYFVLKHLNKPQ